MTDQRTERRLTLESAVSRRLAALHKEYVGRGPTYAHSYMRHNVIVCVMHQTLTKAERRVVSDIGSDAVRGPRRFLHDSLREEACAALEEVTGRHVLSFMSDHDIEHDFLTNVFVLTDDGNGDEPYEWA